VLTTLLECFSPGPCGQLRQAEIDKFIVALFFPAFFPLSKPVEKGVNATIESLWGLPCIFSVFPLSDVQAPFWVPCWCISGLIIVKFPPSPRPPPGSLTNRVQSLSMYEFFSPTFSTI